MEKKIMNIRAWKDAEYRASLSPEQLALLDPNPVGEALTEAELAQHDGGMFENDAIVGPGWFVTISGECNGGHCCNPFGSNIP